MDNSKLAWSSPKIVPITPVNIKGTSKRVVYSIENNGGPFHATTNEPLHVPGSAITMLSPSSVITTSTGPS